MNNGSIREFIDNICKLINVECYFDDSELDAEEIDVLFFGNHEIEVTVSDDLSYFSIYESFPYYDFSSNEIKEGKFDPEELENERRTRLIETLFTHWTRCNNSTYPISVWDDGAYMCPGYVSRVGYHNIPYTDKAVTSFNELVKRFFSKFGSVSNKVIRENIVSLLFKEYNLYFEQGECIVFDENIEFAFINQRIVMDDNVSHFYLGKQYALFKVNDTKYATSSCAVKLFYEAFELCEMYDSVTTYCDGENIVLSSDHMMITLPVIEDRNTYSKLEEMNFLLKANSFEPFASDKFKDSFYKNFSEFIENADESNLIIFTEGITDFMHLKKYWDYLKSDYHLLNILFWDFGMSKDNENYKQNMGGSTLLDMCKSFSRISQLKPMIFIADCDDSKIVKEMSGNGQEKYKSWGNNVYSFTIPIPQHRSGEDGICIEHLYVNGKP